MGQSITGQGPGKVPPDASIYSPQFLLRISRLAKKREMPINRLMKYENVYGPFNLPNGTSIIHLSDTKFYPQNLHPAPPSWQSWALLPPPDGFTGTCPLLRELGFTASWPKKSFGDSLPHTPFPQKPKESRDLPEVSGFIQMDFPVLSAALEVRALEGKVLGVSVCRKTDLLVPPQETSVVHKQSGVWSLAVLQ